MLLEPLLLMMMLLLLLLLQVPARGPGVSEKSGGRGLARGWWWCGCGAWAHFERPEVSGWPAVKAGTAMVGCAGVQNLIGDGILQGRV